LHLIQHKPVENEEEQDQENQLLNPDLSEFDALKDEEDDEFAELAAESLTKKEEVTIVTQVVLPGAELSTEAFGEGSWAEFDESETVEQYCNFPTYMYLSYISKKIIK